MAIKTQFTDLYFIDPADDSVVEVGCVTSIDGLTAPRDQIETTCLNSTGREYEAGMAAPGTATFGINFDPSDASHVRLHELYVTGETLQWALGWSDYAPPQGPGLGPEPTADSNSTFNLPGTRTWLTFEGYVNDLPFNFALNAVVASTVGVQVSGLPALVVKA